MRVGASMFRAAMQSRFCILQQYGRAPDNRAILVHFAIFETLGIIEEDSIYLEHLLGTVSRTRLEFTCEKRNYKFSRKHWQFEVFGLHSASFVHACPCFGGNFCTY